MSACNCCQLFPLQFDLEHRASEFSLNKCGFTNTAFDDTCYDGNGIFLTLTTTWEPEPDDPFDRTTYTIVETYTYDPITQMCSYERDPTYDEAPYDDLGGSGTFSYALSNEYTSEELVENVVEAIPAIDGEWVTGAASAKRELIDKIGGDCYPASLYTERLLEIRIAHPPTATGYLKVWLVKRTQEFDQEAENHGPPTDAPFDEYEWTGEPMDLSAGIDEMANRVNGTTISVPRPDAQTKVTIEVFKYSFLPDYEPDDPTADAENDYALTRPTPDCLSNGVPTLSSECQPAE